MKPTSSFFVGMALMLGWGVLSLQLASAQTNNVAPNSPAPTLEVQISAPVKKDGKRLLLLDPTQPHLNVILRNISDKPLQIYEEWNSWGYYNVHLEITAVNGKAFATPLLIMKAARGWFRNFASTETLASNQSIVRELYLHVPPEIKHPETPATKEEKDRESLRNGDNYWFFPLPKKPERNTVTMKAVFEIKNDIQPALGVWTGRIESEPLTYEIGWDAPRS